MYLKIFVILAVFELSLANHPVIFQKDNSVIATEPMKVSLPQHHQFISVHYPRYEIIANSPEDSTESPPTLSPDDSLPADLIEIASTKLGIKNATEIPSISELSNLLGTTTREETIETIRQLTDTESGIDLIKAFIESSDYTDHTDKKETKLIEADTSGPELPTSILSETTQKDIEIIKKVLNEPKPDESFFQRISSYFNFFDFFPESNEIPISPIKSEVEQIKPKRNHHSGHHATHHKHHAKLQPIPLTNNLPNSFPVPIRPSRFNVPSPVPTTRPRRIKDDHYLHDLNTTFENRFLN